MKSGKARMLCGIAALIAAMALSEHALHAGMASKRYGKTNTSFSAKKFSEQKKFDTSNAQSSLTNEKLSKENFYRNRESSHLNGERAYLPDDSVTGDYSKEKYHKNRQPFNTQEFQRELGKWRGDRQEYLTGDIRQNMSKKYEGKIDINARNVDMQDFLDKYYGRMEERSMREINKYSFRGSHSDDPGIPSVIAGGDELEDESSIFEFLSNKKTIRRKPVSLIGSNKDNNTNNYDDTPHLPTQDYKRMQDFTAYENTQSDIDAEKEDYDALRQIIQREKQQSASQEHYSAFPQNVPLRAPLKKNSESQPPPPQSANLNNAIKSADLSQAKNMQRSRKKQNSETSKIITEEIDPEKVKAFEFMHLPKEISTGKGTIKVEVKEKKW